MSESREKKRITLVSKVFDSRVLSAWTLLLLILIATITEVATEKSYGWIIVAIGIVYVLYVVSNTTKRRKELVSFLEDFDVCLNDTERGSAIHYPSPMVILDLSGKIYWYNERFSEHFNLSDKIGILIQDLLPELQITKFVENEDNELEMTVKDRFFKVNGRVLGKSKDSVRNRLVVLFFTDKTDEMNIARVRENERVVECIVEIDNYAEVLKETPDANHGILMGEIDKKVNDWVQKGDGVCRKYERDKYIIYFSQENFAKIEEDKFSVLDEVRLIDFENKIPVTLSIGVGKMGKNLAETDRFADSAMDMALGRGGDQVVIKDNQTLNFFGAKSREVEKKTKVKSRVVAQGLASFIGSSSKVIVMGHKGADMDSIGASIGVVKAAKVLGKTGYVVVNRTVSNAKPLVEQFENTEEYKDSFITAEQALDMYDSKTLVVVVDTHRAVMTECPELLEHASRVVVIDHHRKSEDFIEDAVLVYHEAFESSTCEMVTEIIQYIMEEPKISRMEAEALYAGIFMDTKGFTVKTGIRTFEAASFLKKMGVDTSNVRRLFRKSLEEHARSTDIINSAEVYREGIAISTTEYDGPDVRLVIAQSADELLDIMGIEASFVLAEKDGIVYISGRSFDKINVHVILEKLGGGGHITMAGAQVKSDSIDEALVLLKNAIDEYVNQQ
ncbi:MAG: DHH family phosphoesterase [Clostridia bacterium]|nr:DHH family phosphoesterase [Clostridia bacterium]